MGKGLLIISKKRFVITRRITLPKTIKAILEPTGIKQSREYNPGIAHIAYLQTLICRLMLKVSFCFDTLFSFTIHQNLSLNATFSPINSFSVKFASI